MTHLIRRYSSLLLGITLLFVCVGSLSGQENYDVFIDSIYAHCDNISKIAKTNRKEIHLECINELLEEICRVNYDGDSLLYVVYQDLANVLLTTGNFREAGFYARAAVSHAENHFGLNNHSLVEALSLQATQEEIENNNLLASILIRQRVENIAKSYDVSILDDRTQIKCIDNLNRLANLYLQTGEFFLAREKLDRSTKLWNSFKLNAIDNFEYDLKHDNFGYHLMHSYATFKIGYPEEAFVVMQKQVELFDSLANAGEYVVNEQIIGKLVWAEIAVDLEQLQLAKVQATEAVSIQEKYAPEALSYESYAKYILAKSWIANGEFEEVPALLEPVLAKLNALAQHSHQQVNFVDIAQLYEVLAKAKMRQATQTQNMALLYEAQAYVQELEQAVDFAWGNLKNQDDLRFTLHQYFEFFETPLELQYQLFQATDSLHYLETAIQLMERSRNIQLRASLRRTDLARELGVPNHLLERQERIQRELFDITYELEQQDAGSDAANQLEEQALQLKNQRQAVTDEIASLAPDLSRAVHQQRNLTIDQIRAQLAPGNQTVLYYTVGENQSFVITLNAEEWSFQRIPMGRMELQELVDNYRTAIYHQPDATTVDDRQHLADISLQLFELLVAPIREKLTDRLVIVPDGPLEILPFSALLLQPIKAEETALSKWPFMIRRHSFNYAYSLELLLQIHHLTIKEPQQKILAFAPDFQGGSLRGIAQRSSGSLKANQEEVSFIEDQFHCEAYYGEEAQLNTFLEKAGEYAVLHLATHAVANDQIGSFSYLSFSETQQDHQLEVGDLYGMKIPAAMVVLSACETGLGEWQRGEGVVGLERAFFYAGAQSLVTTHWKVSDRASANLMSYFYEHLNRGLPKDVALQQAQLFFMAEHDNWLSHPFFWAGFVQKGKTVPLAISKRKSSWLWWVLGGALLVGGIGWSRSRTAA